MRSHVVNPYLVRPWLAHVCKTGPCGPDEESYGGGNTIPSLRPHIPPDIAVSMSWYQLIFINPILGICFAVTILISQSLWEPCLGTYLSWFGHVSLFGYSLQDLLFFSSMDICFLGKRLNSIILKFYLDFCPCCVTMSK